MKIGVLFTVVACILFGGLVAGETLKFKRIFVVVLENQEFWIANLNSHFNALTEKGLLLTNYKAATHPSQPNYIAMIAGDTMGVNSDSVYDIEGRNLVDLLEEKDVTWKTYQEDYPGNCFTEAKSGRYRRKHNPFISFANISTNPERCAKIVNGEQLWEDLKNNSLPQLMFYTPDMDHNGHDTGIIASGKWVSEFIHRLLKHQEIRDETLVILTFDEGLTVGPNKIFTLLIGPGVHAGKMDDTKYNHYSFLRTVEDNFGLGTLGRKDEHAVPYKYKDNPPKFILTMSAFIGIVVAAGVSIMGLSVISGLLIYRRCRRANVAKAKTFAQLDEQGNA